jgi:tryptophan 2,3-dioxygenase
MNKESTVNYVSYLKLDQLLTAQAPLSHAEEGFEHDEMLFIIIHQVYELWFKQMLHELDHLMAQMAANKPMLVLQTFRRVLTILKTLVGQIDILETMTPLQFNSFRAFLESSSGFQSVQFRELEFLMGHKRKTMLAHFPEGLHGKEKLEERYRQPTLWDAFLHFLHDNGRSIPTEHLNRDVTEPIKPSAKIQAVLIDIYREDPITARLCERLLDFDEGLQEWRYRHVKMVARTIGSKQGTGGSAGVKYLESTIQPIWHDLWDIRAKL